MTELKKITKLRFRQFLDTDAGKEGMMFLREHTPSINEGDATKIIFNAGRVEGYKNAIDMISEVISMEEPKVEKLDND